VVTVDEGFAAFEAFVQDVEPRLRRALVATFGAQVGREATVDALAYAWEHRVSVLPMANPAGYLYRVGQTSARRQLRPAPRASSAAEPEEPSFEPGLASALAHLSEQQRACVVLVHGFGWTQREAAVLLSISASTVRNHIDRALSRLRRDLEVRNAH